VPSVANLRVWGQKDSTAGRVHLWIQNQGHSWLNVVSGTAIQPLSGTVTLTGLPAGIYDIEWWDTIGGVVVGRETYSVGASGVMTLAVSNLTTDVAVKALRRSLQGETEPTATPTAIAGATPTATATGSPTATAIAIGLPTATPTRDPVIVDGPAAPTPMPPAVGQVVRVYISMVANG
jgi:hypothetical protein